MSVFSCLLFWPFIVKHLGSYLFLLTDPVLCALSFVAELKHGIQIEIQSLQAQKSFHKHRNCVCVH